MKKAHEIIYEVLEKYRGLPHRLEAITGKSEEWFSSHRREPKSRNPLASGNLSPVNHYLQYVRQYEAAERGAGKTLNDRVYAELRMEFLPADLPNCSQIELHTSILHEGYDVLRLLNECDFKELSDSQLTAVENEAAELRDAASDVVSHVRAIRRMKKANG